MIGNCLSFIIQVQKFGGPPQKNLWAKKMQNFGRFYTTSDFDREYLRNGSRYLKSESEFFQMDSFCVLRERSGELWWKKRPKFRALSDNFLLWSRISPERIDILPIGKIFYQPELLPRLAKKITWTLVHKQKSYRGSCWATQADILRETTIRPLGGAVASNFYTRYRLTKTC